MKQFCLRGDIYYADLNPIVGSEQGGKRPVLVLQNDIGNKHSQTVIVAPMTTKVSKRINFPTHVFVETVMPIPSLILLEQLRTIDKSRLSEYLGKLDDETMLQVNKRMLVSLGMAFEKESFLCQHA